jgi:hypothetical protein
MNVAESCWQGHQEDIEEGHPSVKVVIKRKKMEAHQKCPADPLAAGADGAAAHSMWCKDCNIVAQSVSVMDEHLRTCHKDNSYPAFGSGDVKNVCPFCEGKAVFTSWSSVLRHINHKESLEEIYQIINLLHGVRDKLHRVIWPKYDFCL